jgi:hypothetical protein
MHINISILYRLLTWSTRSCPNWWGPLRRMFDVTWDDVRYIPVLNTPVNTAVNHGRIYPVSRHGYGTGFPPGDPVITPWLPRDYPVITPWFSRDFPVFFPWFSRDFPVISPWFPRDCVCYRNVRHTLNKCLLPIAKWKLEKVNKNVNEENRPDLRILRRRNSGHWILMQACCMSQLYYLRVEIVLSSYLNRIISVLSLQVECKVKVAYLA